MTIATRLSKLELLRCSCEIGSKQLHTSKTGQRCSMQHTVRDCEKQKSRSTDAHDVIHLLPFILVC